MTISEIESDFNKTVSDKIRLSSDGIDRYRVFTPFRFDDGDHIAIILKKEKSDWVLTDEGHSYMHLTYDLEEEDLYKGTRQKIIENTLSCFSVKDRDGELLINVKDNKFGDSLYSFMQAILKIMDVSFLSRERTKSSTPQDP